MAIYVLTSVLVAVLAAISLIAFAVGVLGAFGMMQIKRCTGCGHLTWDRVDACPYCRHPHLAHPFASLRNAHLRNL